MDNDFCKLEEIEEAELEESRDTDNLFVNENVVEFRKNSKTMYVTFSQKRFIKKIKMLAETFPDKVIILAENDDGSIHAKLPVKALKINLVQLTDEQSVARAERMRAIRNQ